MVRKPDVEIDLAAAALLIAEEEYSGLDVSRYMGELDRIGDAVGAEMGHRFIDPADAIVALNTVLFEREGFTGNRDDYYDPRNSYLNDVIDRKTGIPITLSIVYKEVASRVGLALDGVGFPGHFLLKHTEQDRHIVIDPYFGGRTLDLDDLSELLRGVMGEDARLDSRHLMAVDKRAILARILRNLRGIFVGAPDLPRALGAIERLLILEPDDTDLRRERDEIEGRLGQAH